MIRENQGKGGKTNAVKPRYEAAAGTLVDGPSAGAEGAVGGAWLFDLSSTPSPRQRGQELRPVVNHYFIISKMSKKKSSLGEVVTSSIHC